MALETLLSPESVILDLKVNCKREVLAHLAGEAAKILDVDADIVRDALMDREQLGSTGVGSGVAIPHGKIEGLGQVTGILARLSAPIDFDAVDDEPVDLVFLLLAPADASAAHLKALAKVSRMLRDEQIRAALRGAQTAEALFAAATRDPAKSDAA